MTAGLVESGVFLRLLPFDTWVEAIEPFLYKAVRPEETVKIFVAGSVFFAILVGRLLILER